MGNIVYKGIKEWGDGFDNEWESDNLIYESFICGIE